MTREGKLVTLYLQIYKYMYPLALAISFLGTDSRLCIIRYNDVFKKARQYSYICINNIWQISSAFPPNKTFSKPDSVLSRIISLLTIHVVNN